MGFLDDAKSRLTKAVDQHGDKIHGGIDKAGQLVNERTGGKHADKVAQATGRARGALDSFDSRNQAGTAGTTAPDPTVPDPAPPAPDPLRPPTEQPGLPTDPTNPATG